MDTLDEPVADVVLPPPYESQPSDLLKISPIEFRKLQKADPTLQNAWNFAKNKINKNKVKFYIERKILKRRYTDKFGRVIDQIVVPQQFREELLRMSHSNVWSSHLGMKKTKRRLLDCYYWPFCFRDCENYVKACEVGQHIGKIHESVKAPLVLVPVISEPFKRVNIDIVGPLPETSTGHKYLLTFICGATKFPDAVPLAKADSISIVNATIDVF